MTIEFVTLKVYDILGNEIEILVNKENSAGNYEVEFNELRLKNYYFRLFVKPSYYRYQLSLE